MRTCIGARLAWRAGMSREPIRQLFVVLVALLFVASPAQAESRIELELGLAAAYAESGAPAATGRFGLQLFDVIRPGVRGQAIFGPRGAGKSDGQNTLAGGYQAWSVTPELQLSTPTED